MQLPGRKTCMFWQTFGRGMMKNVFHHILAESITFAPRSETRMWYFRLEYDKKSYVQHGDKEGHPRPHVGWQFTRALDWPTLYLPWCVIYYFSILFFLQT